MTTRATATLQGIAGEWEKLFGSAKFNGIVGDTSHALRGGYHISIMDQTDPNNYSVVRPDDKAPPGTWPRDCASAIDMNLALADMKVCHARLVAVWRNRATDVRARYINGHNGWDGNGSPGRYDWVSGVVSTATEDHRWHVHLEIRRRYVNDPRAAAAVLSILRGQSLDDYLEEINMPTAAEIAEAVWSKALADPAKPGSTKTAGDYQRYNDVVNRNTISDFFFGAYHAAVNDDAYKTADADTQKSWRNARDTLRGIVGGPVSQGDILAAVAQVAGVDEQALASALAPALAAAVTAQLPQQAGLTQAQVEDAVRTVLRTGTETPA